MFRTVTLAHFGAAPRLREEQRMEYFEECICKKYEWEIRVYLSYHLFIKFAQSLNYF